MSEFLAVIGENSNPSSGYLVTAGTQTAGAGSFVSQIRIFNYPGASSRTFTLTLPGGPTLSSGTVAPGGAVRFGNGDFSATPGMFMSIVGGTNGLWTLKVFDATGEVDSSCLTVV